MPAARGESLTEEGETLQSLRCLDEGGLLSLHARSALSWLHTFKRGKAGVLAEILTGKGGRL